MDSLLPDVAEQAKSGLLIPWSCLFIVTHHKSPELSDGDLVGNGIDFLDSIERIFTVRQ